MKNKEKPDLYEERMSGQGGAYDNRQNYLKGLDDLCLYHQMAEEHNVLELGVNDGVSTSLFAYYSNNVTGVDLVKSDKLQRNLEKNTNISFHQGDINDIVPNLPNNHFDFIYIDANHQKEFVLRDIEISIPKLKRGGIICGHDYIHEEPKDHGVRGAVDEFFKDSDVNFFNDTSWSVQIKK